MQLEKFKANEQKLRQEKKWTEPEWKDFIGDYEKMLARQKNQITQFEEKWSRSGGNSALNSSEQIKIEPRVTGDALQGGKFVAPPGFGETYKQFTGDVSGVKR